MEKITKLTAEAFAKRIKSLDVGEHFYFASDVECDGVPQDETDLAEWYGIQKICLFDKEMCVVSKCGGTGCDAFSTDNDYIETAVNNMFVYMLLTDVVYAAEGNQKQERSISLNSSFCIDIRGYTGCGENILIPSSKMHELMDEIDKRYAEEDIAGRIEESGVSLDFSNDELSEMAAEVIDRRDDCDLIYEIYWQIVEETIEKFSAKKTAF